MKRTFKYVKMLTVLVASAAVVLTTGCKEEQPYVANGIDGPIYCEFGGTGSTEERLIVSTQGCIGDNYAISVSYDMYTNAPDWEIVPDYSECYDSEYDWVTASPSIGSHDGRFTLKFQANQRQGDTRCANVNIVSGGQIIKTIRVEQEKAQTTQLYIQPFLQTLNFKADDEVIKTIPLDANVAWSARVNDDENGDPVDWIVISGVTKGKFDVSVLPNSGADREGSITVYQNTNGNNNIIVTIKQAGVGVADAE